MIFCFMIYKYIDKDLIKKKKIENINFKFILKSIIIIVVWNLIILEVEGDKKKEISDIIISI